MKQILILLSLAISCVVISCSGPLSEEFGVGNTSPELKPIDGADSLIVNDVFAVLNLDYPGLEKVKEAYEENKLYRAAYELREYWRGRSHIFNPVIDLISTSITSTQQRIADQAQEHRFFINNNYYESYESGVYTYYLFEKDGKIDWTFVPSGLNDQEFYYQLHRHQWMEPQAKAYRVSRDEKYVISLLDTYKSWLETYPCPVGVKFPEGESNNINYQWKGLQTACRVLLQPNVLSYIIQSENLTPEILTWFLCEYAKSVEAVRLNYYKETNILITQAQAVASAGILMPEFKNASTWATEGTTKLSDELDTQFLADGVHYELDPSYHIAAIADFREIFELVRANDCEHLFASDKIEKLEKATQFVADIMYPNYSLESFNDTRASSYTKSVLTRNLKEYVKLFPENKNMEWLATQGISGLEPNYLTASYPKAGYCMTRDAWTDAKLMLIHKNNYNYRENSSEPNFWHCQPDNGTFSLWIKGRVFFPDAGCYTYNTGSSRRQYASTANHNTVTIGENTLGTLYQKGKILEASDERLKSENKLNADLTHQRTIKLHKEKSKVVAISIYDKISGAVASELINLNYHLLSNETNPTIIGDLSGNQEDGKTVISNTKFTDGNNVFLKSFAQPGKEVVLKKVSSNYSTTLNVVTGIRAGYRMGTNKEQNKDLEFVSVILPLEGNEDLDASFDWTDYEVHLGEKQYSVK